MMKVYTLLALSLALAGWLTGVPRLQAQDNEALTALVQLIGDTDDVQFQLDLLRGMNEGLQGRRGVPMPAGWDKLAQKLSETDHAELRGLVQSLSLTFGSAAALTGLRQVLMDPDKDVAERRKALQSLLAAKDPQLGNALRKLLADPELRSPALKALAAYDEPQTPAAILDHYGEFSLGEKRDALNTLVSRASFAKALLDGIRRQVLPARDLTADVVRQLRQFKDEEMNKAVETLWGMTREQGADMLQLHARYKALMEKGPTGNLHRGRAVYAQTCQQCHALFGVGGKVGPDITGSNRNDLDYLLHNILDPNAEIPNDYRTSSVETKDERFITGIIARDDETAVTVITANDTVTVPKAEVAEIVPSELSMMPEGLGEVLGESRLRDLIAYLKSPIQVPMQAEPDNVGAFFNGVDLAGWDGNLELWKVEKGEIVGRTDGLKHNEWLAAPLLLGDFKFSCQVKLLPNSENSGIQFRSERLDNGEVKGYQADMGAGWWGKLYEEHGRALLWDKSGESHVKKDQWNLYEIQAEGSRIRTYLNGQLCVDLDDPKGARSGVIAFQMHSGGAMEIRIKDLQVELVGVEQASR